MVARSSTTIKTTSSPTGVHDFPFQGNDFPSKNLMVPSFGDSTSSFEKATANLIAPRKSTYIEDNLSLSYSSSHDDADRMEEEWNDSDDEEEAELVYMHRRHPSEDDYWKQLFGGDDNKVAEEKPLTQNTPPLRRLKFAPVVQEEFYDSSYDRYGGAEESKDDQEDECCYNNEEEKEEKPVYIYRNHFLSREDGNYYNWSNAALLDDDVSLDSGVVSKESCERRSIPTKNNKPNLETVIQNFIDIFACGDHGRPYASQPMVPLHY